MQETPEEIITPGDNQLDRFQRLTNSDQTGDNTENSGFGATWNGLRRWRLWEEAAVTGSAKMRRKKRGLSFELVDRAVDVWFPFPNAHVAGKVTRRQIIGTIDYDVVIADQLDGVAGGQSCRVGLDDDRWVDGKQTRARRIGFLAATVVRSMRELPVM